MSISTEVLQVLFFFSEGRFLHLQPLMICGGSREKIIVHISAAHLFKNW